MTEIITKSIMGLALALLVLAGVNVFGDLLMQGQEQRQAERVAKELAKRHGGVMEEPTAQADKTPKISAEEAEAMSLGARLAAATPEAGAKLSAKCKSCHTFEDGDAHRVGPNLYNTVGAKRGGKDGYSYSDAFGALGGSWSYEELDTFLSDPMGTVKGTKMSFAGFRHPMDRANMIAYLRSLTDLPPELPDPGAAPAPKAEAAPAQAPAQAPAAAPAPKAEATDNGDEGDDDAVTVEVAGVTGSSTAGAKVVRQCKSCHTFDKGGRKMVGPNLYGTFGAPVAAKDFNYSKGMKALGGEWTPERLDQLLEKPMAFVKGTRMSFAGLRDAQDRADAIAYLKSLSDD